MNKGWLIFIGIFLTLAASWAGIVLLGLIQFGHLKPYYDPIEGKLFPEIAPGQALRGRVVYQDLECMSCHTQQVRRPGYGSDVERGWGTRQSVARDYIYESQIFLGSRRTGPDLRNLGARQSSPDWHFLHLYDPQLTTPGSLMPPSRFLFEYRKVDGERSPRALKLPGDYASRHGLNKPGHELVPLPRAELLVAYLMSLKDSCEFPEAKPYLPSKREGINK